jgi:type II secretion system protein L
MITLRILVAATPGAGADVMSWALYDATGVCTATGRDAPDDWPAADGIEIVLAASQVRLAAVTLPPLHPARVAAAAAFALEDQLAGPAEDLRLAASAQRPDGRVVVAIVARSLLDELRAQLQRTARSPRVTRVVAEPDLAAPGNGWCWCLPADSPEFGFVRLPDGSAFPVDRAEGTALPAEIALALAGASRSAALPAEIRVDGPVDDAHLAQWHAETRVPFVRGSPWTWHGAPASAFAHAIDLGRGEFASAAPPRSGARMRVFVPAMAIAVAALALHVVLTIGEWAWWRVDAWRAARAWTALAVAAGIPEADAQTPAAARSALDRRYATARHAQGLAAPDDALPLLARAAPALAAMPPGILKTATYADGRWTLDLQTTDAAAVAALDARFKQSGTPAISATTAAGTRLRFGAF